MTWFYIQPNTYNCHKCGEQLHDDNVATDFQGFPAQDVDGNHYCRVCAMLYADEIAWADDDEEEDDDE